MAKKRAVRKSGRKQPKKSAGRKSAGSARKRSTKARKSGDGKSDKALETILKVGMD